MGDFLNLKIFRFSGVRESPTFKSKNHLVSEVLWNFISPSLRCSKEVIQGGLSLGASHVVLPSSSDWFLTKISRLLTILLRVYNVIVVLLFHKFTSIFYLICYWVLLKGIDLVMQRSSKFIINWSVQLWLILLEHGD